LEDRKLKIILLIFLFNFSLFGVEIVNRPMPQEVIDTALSYKNLIDFDGKKSDKTIQKFLKSVGLFGSQPYCMAFVYYCHSVNEIKEFKTGLANGYYSSLKKKYGYKNGKVENKIGLIVWKYANSVSGHIGFVLCRVKVGYVQTIEGNTSWDNSSPDGRIYAGKKGVFVKIRKLGKLGNMQLRGVVQ
jgi:hypothetical protein